ncbi:MAG: ethanolamine ammonia-lyase, partial [Planctomycetota bacterium]
MDEAQLNAIIEAVVKELAAAKIGTPPASGEAAPAPKAATSTSAPPSTQSVQSPREASNLNIDLPDPPQPEP